MDEWALARVAKWDSEPFGGDIAALHDLAEAGFSGAIEAGRTWVMMLNGRVIGRWGGALASVDADGGAIYHAPDQSLPLLLTMLAAGGVREGSYYSEKVPLESVHETLESGNFTGYLELSDNVLSGDYYIVYYGGRALPVAFVGASERCITGDEAFDRAADEVGIYEVRSVEIDVESLPDPPSAPATTTAPPADPEVVDDDEPDQTPTESADSEPVIEDEPEEAAASEASSVDADPPEPDPEPDPADTPWQPAEPARTTANDGAPSVTAIPSIDPDRTSKTTLHPPTSQQVDDDGAPPAEASTEPTEPDPIETERDELADEVKSLEAELESLRETVAEQPAPPADIEPEPVGQPMAPDAALADSHLFVRYGTRGGPTLERAVEGNVDSAEVSENLLLERHTSFEDAGTTVGGVTFDRFFDDRLEVRFTRWLLEELLVEIDQTASRAALADLVMALAQIDRIDFLEPIDAVEDHIFDVVARDRMGEPVILADVDPGRSATTAETMRELVTASTEVAAAHPNLGAAVVVTESFFQPEALEIAQEATSKSLLGRSDKESYVRVARGVGYHLCLVECRSETFHVTTPTL